MDKKVYEFIARKAGENIVEWKKCSCGEEFLITDRDLEFYDKVSPVFSGKKYSIPAPTLCPDCRQQRGLSWKNERKLYKVNSSLSGKSIISMYHEKNGYKIYAEDEWENANWSSLNYGRDFDFSRSFFEQFAELLKDVPLLALDTTANENSEYTNQCGYLKNCYLCFEVGFCQDCYYSGYMRNADNCMDILQCNNIQESYECVECFNSYGLKYCFKCDNCRDSSFLFDCKGCSNCFGCVGLNNKQYYFFNKKCSEKEYIDKLKEFSLGNKATVSNFDNKYSEFKRKYFLKNISILSGENCFGNTIEDSKDVVNSYDIRSSSNVRYSYGVYSAKDCMDHTGWGNNAEKILDCSAIGNNVYNILFSCQSTESSNLIYCFNCQHGIQNCFGCIGVHSNQSYCILNKQYTKEEYEELVPKIIESMKKTGEWGEFFPSSISPFGYNETVASEYFPLNRNEAISKGFNWSDYEAPFPKVDKTIPASKLPDNISDIPDDILNWAIECEVSGKPFRIIKQELEFYRKHNLPIPRRHPDIRHMDRMNKRAPRKLFLRNCDKCGIEMISVYDKDSEYKVYCEGCYSKEII